MEKPPKVPTNAELYKQLQELQNKVTKLEYDIECLKSHNERLKYKGR